MPSGTPRRNDLDRAGLVGQPGAGHGAYEPYRSRSATAAIPASMARSLTSPKPSTSCGGAVPRLARKGATGGAAVGEDLRLGDRAGQRRRGDDPAQPDRGRE